MKLEKLIKIYIDYDSFNIHQSYVAFKIKKYSENQEINTIHQGITSLDNWNSFINNPFEFTPKPINDNYYYCLFEKNELYKYPSFDEICLNDSETISIINHPSENKVSFDLLKSNSNKQIFVYDYIVKQNSSSQDANAEFHFLKYLDGTIAYWEPGFTLPYLYQTTENLPIFENLLHLIKDFPENFSLRNPHFEGNTLTDILENGIDEIKNPYIHDENDFSAPEPSIYSSLGFFKFKPIHLPNFDKLFNIAQNYIQLHDCITEENFKTIINLTLLKICFPNHISDDFYQIFPEENKKANSILLDWKLTHKNTTIKKAKI